MLVFEGMKICYRPRPDWGVGHLLSLDQDAGRASILFPDREDPVLVSTKGEALVRHTFAVDDLVLLQGSRSIFEVLEIVDRVPGSPFSRYRIQPRGLGGQGGTPDELIVDEAVLFAAPPSPDLVESLRAGRVGDARSFLLRKEALRLDDERRSDALGALFAARVMPLPYQVGVVQRVLSSPRPRFILAEEVGLGKTIEAGMIFSALRLSGLAKRVLVVAPSHLTVQWLVELAQKFNRLFTLMDGDRYAAQRSLGEDRSPWASHDLVVTSLELLARDGRHLEELSAEEAAWDLVIVDEAHHLRAKRAYGAVEVLAANTWGLLLLTATPMKLDPEEYHRLLTLIDPAGAPPLEALKGRISRQEEISAAVRQLMEGAKKAGTMDRLAALFPGDPVLEGHEEMPGDAAAGIENGLLAHIAETYSLSDYLIRNRRSAVGGFTERRLHRHAFTLPSSERQARVAVMERLRELGSIHGVVLSTLLRRLDSSTAAFTKALSSNSDLSSLIDECPLPERDAKAERFLQVLSRIREQEPGAKVLVFTESKATLEWLVLLLAREGILALGYHGELGLVERDRHVTRFRDPEGPQVLVSTEVGGEGRNFQFCHHLIHYDLPWSPSAVEQRIGRLDRIGQTHPVEIHVLEPQGSLAADVVSILDESVGVFKETVGGLDAVLEEVEPRLVELGMQPPEARRSYARELSVRVSEARAQVRRAYDPLLDLRSADRPAVEAVARRASRRLGLCEDEPEVPDLPDARLRELLWGIARDLDERLEETVTEIAGRLGMGVDLDEQVEAFHCAFHLGHALKVDALPGIDINEERTLLGTFWRDTAIEHEEIDYFATGHPVVEALLSFLKDAPFGRAAFRIVGKAEGRREPIRGMELIFHLEDPRPEDVEAGARFPARQLTRFLENRLVRVVVTIDDSGELKIEAPLGDETCANGIFELLDSEEGRTLRGDEIDLVFPGFRLFVPRSLSAATDAAARVLRARSATAGAAIESELTRAISRLELSMDHQELPMELREERLHERIEHYQGVLGALERVRPVLDSACGFAIFGQ